MKSLIPFSELYFDCFMEDRRWKLNPSHIIMYPSGKYKNKYRYSQWAKSPKTVWRRASWCQKYTPTNCFFEVFCLPYYL